MIAQFDIAAGMGLHLFSAPDFEDYFNSNTGTTEVGSFNTSADFFTELGYEINSKIQLSIDYTFNIYSAKATILDIELDQHKPSLLAYYFYKGKGYKFKIGAGLGLRYSAVTEKIISYGVTTSYSTSGIGFISKVQGDTQLGGDWYALIAGELRYDLPGDIETDNGGKFNLNSFGVTLKLGTVYYF